MNTATPPREGKEARRIKLFLVAHVSAVVAIYAVALAVGGGFAAAPMPPEQAAVGLAPPTAAALPQPATDPAPPAPPVHSAWDLRAAIDTPAPWTQEPGGPVRWRTE